MGLADEGVDKFYVRLVRGAVASNKANVSKCEYFLEVARTEATSPAVSLRREIFFLLPENRRGKLQMRFRLHTEKFFHTSSLGIYIALLVFSPNYLLNNALGMLVDPSREDVATLALPSRDRSAHLLGSMAMCIH
jgi:hypothetical protein